MTEAAAKPDLDVIVVAGAPGSGKSSLCRKLRARWNVVPHVDLGNLRSIHLDKDWHNESAGDEAVGFENLVSIVRNYVARGWRPVLVSDLQDWRVIQVPSIFRDLKYAIITLTCSDEILTQRISARTLGYRDAERAVAWNKAVRNRKLIANELCLDNSSLDEGSTAEAALRLLAERAS